MCNSKVFYLKCERVEMQFAYIIIEEKSIPCHYKHKLLSDYKVHHILLLIRCLPLEGCHVSVYYW